MKKTSFILIILISILFAVQLEAATEKPRVSVIDCKEIACEIDGVGRTTAQIINDFLTKVRRVSVISASSIRPILSRQNISVDSIINSRGSSIAGRLSNLDYLIMGEVSDVQVVNDIKEVKYSEKDKDGNTVKKSKNVLIWAGTASVMLRIIDVKSGRIIYSNMHQETKTKQEDYISSKKEDIASVVKAVKKVMENPNKTHPELALDALKSSVSKFFTDLYNTWQPIGYIINIQKADSRGKNYNVTIDLGFDFGLKKREPYDFLRIGKSMIHPVTKEEIPGEETIILKARIKDVGSNTATIQVKANKINLLKVGMPIKASVRKGLFAYY